jgi:hypothetical protein
MQRKHKVPIVLVALLFVLGAAAEIATGRGRGVPDPDVTERTRQTLLVSVEDALSRHDVAGALRAWQQAYDLARRSRSWRGLAEAADAHIRIGAVANASTAAAPRAREIYLAALGRARAERSVAGAVRAAEGFAALGDREVTELALRIADSLAARSSDADAPMVVELARGRLLQRSSPLALITF